MTVCCDSRTFKPSSLLTAITNSCRSLRAWRWTLVEVFGHGGELLSEAAGMEVTRVRARGHGNDSYLRPRAWRWSYSAEGGASSGWGWSDRLTSAIAVVRSPTFAWYLTMGWVNGSPVLTTFHVGFDLLDAVLWPADNVVDHSAFAQILSVGRGCVVCRYDSFHSTYSVHLFPSFFSWPDEFSANDNNIRWLNRCVKSKAEISEYITHNLSAKVISARKRINRCVKSKAEASKYTISNLSTEVISVAKRLWNLMFTPAFTEQIYVIIYFNNMQSLSLIPTASSLLPTW